MRDVKEMIENGMVIDPCGKLYNYAKWYDDENGYCGKYDEMPEEFVDVFFGIDTSKLTADEENSLWNKLDGLAYKTNNPDDPDINLGELEVTLIEKGTFEDEDLYGYIQVIGYARESVYEELETLIDEYNVGLR
ncbi:MAG: hypothetical protein IJS29_02320 [Selenomonadaceae bacterium]|nr:hypothetical protein [Selenomonadaceae bacterium]